MALIGTALLPLFRQQVRAFAKWMLAPLNRILPWRQQRKRQHGLLYETALLANFTLVQVFIEDAIETVASYRKLSNYSAREQFYRYREGVSADGTAANFSTMRGAIVQTQSEHGFFVSEINLEAAVDRGACITNMYEAKLLDCFSANEEY